MIKFKKGKIVIFYKFNYITNKLMYLSCVFYFKL